MKVIAGIYRIVNQINHKVYIGSSKSITRRFGIHKSALRHNRHHCIYLQRSWNKHGEQAFKFEVIKEMTRPTKTQLFEEELSHIQTLLPAYNVGGVGGGDNLTNHPNRNDIIRRITDTMHKKVAVMTKEERKHIWSRPGQKNPNWKGGISIVYCKDCKKEINYGNIRCMECSKQGENNPFYGKHHTDEYRKKASVRMKGKLPSNTNPIVLDGISYLSQTDAARKLGVSIGTISNWVRGKVKRPRGTQSLDEDCNLSTQKHPTPDRSKVYLGN